MAAREGPYNRPQGTLHAVAFGTIALSNEAVQYSSVLTEPRRVQTVLVFVTKYILLVEVLRTYLIPLNFEKNSAAQLD